MFIDVYWHLINVRLRIYLYIYVYLSTAISLCSDNDFNKEATYLLTYFFSNGTHAMS